MPKLKPSDLVKEIARLGINKTYGYYTGRTKIKITEIIAPEGPINFIRWDSRESENTATSGSISIKQLSTAASVFSGKPNYPIHFDRLFSAGGNSRSAFESLLAYTPQFFICYPQRTNPYTSSLEKKLKHIMWCPSDKHEIGNIGQKEYEQVISEIEFDTDFEKISVTEEMLNEEFDSIAAKKTHTQIQVALVKIGNAFNFHTYIARNDQSILVGDTQLGKMDGVIQTLDVAKILYKIESKRAASLIDCIWFTDDYDFIPAVIEVEHSTGVTSGLTRMLKFKQTIPATEMTFTIVAPDELRNKVVSEANNLAFRKLKARFMPYSNVRFLYGMIQKFSVKDVEGKIVESFMEKIVE
jgi:type II restriction enzyme